MEEITYKLRRTRGGSCGPAPAHFVGMDVHLGGTSPPAGGPEAPGQSCPAVSDSGDQLPDPELSPFRFMISILDMKKAQPGVGSGASWAPSRVCAPDGGGSHLPERVRPCQQVQD